MSGLITDQHKNEDAIPLHEDVCPIGSNIDKEVICPPQMGKPRDDQCIGTPAEIVSEIAGRVCYDSIGKGRSSAEFHQHILDIGHLSIYEHANFTLQLHGKSNQWPAFVPCLLNRPGIFVTAIEEAGIRFSVNLRAILEWEERTTLWPSEAKVIGTYLQFWGNKIAPRVILNPPQGQFRLDIQQWSRLVPPKAMSEIWFTFWFKGSRGFSHELVRHGDWTAISQRSTRYCDESDAEMCWHPLLGDADFTVANDNGPLAINEASQSLYMRLANQLEVQGHTRKEARGAARGVLPNAMATQLVFSATLSQWQHIIAMRCSEYADAEIRNIISHVRDYLPKIQG